MVLIHSRFTWILPEGLTPTDSIFTNSNLRFNAVSIDDFINIGCSNSEYQTLEDCVDNGFIWTDSDGIQDFGCSNKEIVTEQDCCEDNGGVFYEPPYCVSNPDLMKKSVAKMMVGNGILLMRHVIL